MMQLILYLSVKQLGTHTGDGLYPRDEKVNPQSGYVGINTSLPDRQLHIVGSDEPVNTGNFR